MEQENTVLLTYAAQQVFDSPWLNQNGRWQPIVNGRLIKRFYKVERNALQEANRIADVRAKLLKRYHSNILVMERPSRPPLNQPNQNNHIITHEKEAK